MTVISVRIFLPLGLAMLLPLALAGCGSAGSGSALKDSAHLPPPLVQENKPAAVVAEHQTRDESSKKTKLTAKISDLEAKPALVPKASSAAKQIVTSNVDTPPIPVRRPYRKVRQKTAARMIKDEKTSAKIADKMTATLVVKSKTQAIAKPVVTPLAVAKVPKVEMVPAKAVPAQVASDETPELIFGGFIDGSGVNASHEVSAEELDAAKMAQATSVAEKPSFGQSEYRFSGQK